MVVPVIPGEGVVFTVIVFETVAVQLLFPVTVTIYVVVVVGFTVTDWVVPALLFQLYPLHASSNAKLALAPEQIMASLFADPELSVSVKFAPTLTTVVLLEDIVEVTAVCPK